ncbi:MAG: phage protease [Flavonifractor plautii]
MRSRLADRDAEEAVELALKSGKITPAQKEWAKGYALKSPDGFKSFLEKAPQVVPMSEVAGGETLALKGKKPDEATMLICKRARRERRGSGKVRHEGGVTSWQH